MRTPLPLRTSRIASALSLVAVSTVVACTAGSDAPQGAEESAIERAPKFCGALKGNGPRILAQIASMARNVEEFGEFDALAGGSSASISTFLYESMLMNPAVSQCAGGVACTPKERQARLALLLKTVHGYGEIVLQEAGLTKLAEDIKKLQVSNAQTPAELRETVEAVRKAMNSNIQAVLNTKELLPMLRVTDTKQLAFNVEEIQTAFRQFGNFVVPDNRILFRAPILDWDAAARVFGRAADFYAGEGYGRFDKAKTSSFLNDCAPATLGKTWTEAKNVTTSGGTCGERFQSLLTAHRAGLGDVAIRHRINDPVGKKLRALVHSTAIVGDTAKSYASALDEYKTGKFASAGGDVPTFAPNFKDVVYGYWSSAADGESIAKISTSSRFTDLKSKKIAAFGPRTWEHILARSPAEPGISRLVKSDNSVNGETTQHQYTSGGWGDGLPSQVLRQIGCETVVLITRQDKGAANFATDLAGELGATQEQVAALYDQGPASGVVSQSLKAADGVWCTDWDKPLTSDQVGLTNEGYNAPLITKSPKFSAYGNLQPSARIAGCTPGVKPGG